MKKELFYSQDGKFILIDAITKIIHTLGNLEEVFYHDSLKKQERKTFIRSEAVTMS